MTVGSGQNIIASKDMTLNIYDKPIEKKTTTKLLACVCSLKPDLLQTT